MTAPFTRLLCRNILPSSGLSSSTESRREIPLPRNEQPRIGYSSPPPQPADDFFFRGVYSLFFFRRSRSEARVFLPRSSLTLSPPWQKAAPSLFPPCARLPDVSRRLPSKRGLHLSPRFDPPPPSRIVDFFSPLSERKGTCLRQMLFSRSELQWRNLFLPHRRVSAI